jgi:glycosyltransferase involved in cell wall biosynthesis
MGFKNKGVVLINQSSGYLMIDIANAFCTRYDQVVLLTGILKPMERAISSAVKVQKIIRYNRKSRFSRLLTWSWGSFQILLLLLFKYRRYEVIFTTNPPSAFLTSVLIRNEFSIIIWDLYPDSLKNIGIGENHFLYRRWAKWNRWIFSKAGRIFTLSEGMASAVSKYISREKIKVIPNWAGTDKISPVPRDQNPFLLKHDLSGKFIVQYSGNIGFTHDLETIVEVAGRIQNENDIRFLIIGEGGKKKQLQQMVQDYNLNNCIFMTWVTNEMFKYSLASADIAVITLSDESSDSSLPSKTFNYLAAGVPLLCISNEKSELSQLVNKYQNGACFAKDRIEEIMDYILKLSKDRKRQTQLSISSLEASKDFTFANAEKYL